MLTFIFCGLLVTSLVVMKGLSWGARGGEVVPLGPFAFSPLICVSSWARVVEPESGELRRIALKMVLALVGLVVFYGLYQQVGLTEAVRPWIPLIWSYLAVPIALLLGEFAGPFTQLCCAVGGNIIPDYHMSPLRSASLSEFWGARWNVWVSDWYRQMIFGPLRRQPGWALFSTFLFSGLWHETLINVPYFVVKGQVLFGTQLGYFLIQYVGMLAERGLPRNARVLRRAYVWLVVVGPVPLFLNRSMLEMMRLG